jgi:putative nucleotidyltransferase with HDIG domain
MLHQTKVLLDRASLQRTAGRLQSAVDLYHEAYRRSIAEKNAEGVREAVLSMGHCYRDMDNTVLAIEHFELAITVSESVDDYGRIARAMNGLAIIYMQQGKGEEAENQFRRAKELALIAGDLLTAGSTDHNLGALANIRGDLQSALQYYDSCFRSYEKLKSEQKMAGVLNNLGMLYIDLNQLADASVALHRALDLSRMVGDVVTEGVVHANITELFLALSQPDEARISCDEAFEIASRIGDNRIKSESLKFYGIIYNVTGKPHLAEIHLRQAIAITSNNGYLLTEAESQRELSLVLRAQERNREALEALNRAHSLFSQLQAKQEQADINKRIDQLEDDFLSLVRMWGESIEAKDRYTRGHCQRVANYACRIAEYIGIPEREMVWFRMGAFLHDVGKTEVPEEILNKPGRLTDQEREVIERHTIIGDEMLSSIEFPWDIRSMVRSHHERWDGRGYPDALRGDDIPLTARILRLADIFDALTTTRSYREPLSPEQAFQIMADDHGSFDPALFETFRELFPEFSEMAVRERDGQSTEAPAPSSGAS